MNEQSPKVEFALGSQISPSSAGHYFKSSFARSFVINCRDVKSLNLDCMDNNGITDEESDNNLSSSDSRNNNFSSLMNFGAPPAANFRVNTNGPQSSTWQTFNETTATNQPDNGELEKLRKQCQTLTEENRKLEESLRTRQVPRTRMIDNVLLQTRIDTLQWQLKQTESNRQMYRSLMEQILRFLERARKSLDILHEKSNARGKVASRASKCRSFHGIEESDKGAGSNEDKRASPSSSASSSGSKHRQNVNNSTPSRFTRAKSVAQISPQSPNGCLRDFTWSVLRKNDPGHCTPPRSKQQRKTPPVDPPVDQNRTTPPYEGVVYRRPQHPAEIDPDNVPPEKLSQEAFRLMRTVQSLLVMREPDLAMISSNDPETTSNAKSDNELDSSRRRNGSVISDGGSFANSSHLNDAASYNSGCSSSDRGSTGSGAESERACYRNSSSTTLETSTAGGAGGGGSSSSSSTLRSLIPRARRSIDVASINSNSGSGKTTEEEEEEEEDRSKVSPQACPTSTPNRRAVDKTEKKEPSRWLRSKFRAKPSRSVSSAEDESGFSSMSSFQEVGLPLRFPNSPVGPVKGCHTEVGLPEIPMSEIPRRRWSSTPTEISTMFKRHSAHFTASGSNAESLSVWV